MQYLIGILIGVGIISIWQFFIRKSYQIGYKQGSNQAIVMIFNQIQKTGKIELQINDNKMTIIELKAPNIPPAI